MADEELVKGEESGGEGEVGAWGVEKPGVIEPAGAIGGGWGPTVKNGSAQSIVHDCQGDGFRRLLQRGGEPVYQKAHRRRSVTHSQKAGATVPRAR